jgi:predicted PurR-regulated permease PerM
MAVAVTFTSFLAIFVGALIVFVPMAVSQSALLGSNIQVYYDEVVKGVTQRNYPVVSRLMATLRRYHIPSPTADQLLKQYQADIGIYLRQLLDYLLLVVRNSASRLIWVVIIPIVTLYLLIDFEHMRQAAYERIPAAHREATLRIIAAVGKVFMSYLRGLFTVCLAYGIALGIILGFCFRLPYAAVLALAGGILYAVPYIGPIATIGIAAMVAWATSEGDSWRTAMVAGTALIMNEVFDFVITPRVLSKEVGLHPILNIFALMVGGSLFGFIGLILAVPVAASIKTVIDALWPPPPKEEAAAVHLPPVEEPAREELSLPRR